MVLFNYDVEQRIDSIKQAGVERKKKKSDSYTLSTLKTVNTSAHEDVSIFYLKIFEPLLFWTDIKF